MPEIAEREPKVFSVGCGRVGWLFRGRVVRLRAAQGCFCPAESFSKRAGIKVGTGLRKWSSLPRLETRTKESDTGASIVVANHCAQ